MLTTSGVLAPSVCDVESALERAVSVPLVEPPSSGSGFDESRSSITRSMGILPLRQLMYRWQKLSQSSWTWKHRNKQVASEWALARWLAGLHPTLRCFP